MMLISDIASLIRDDGNDMDVVPGLDLVAVYVDCRTLLRDLLSRLDAPQLAAAVPACPGWTVKDVVAHLVAIAAQLSDSTYPDPDNVAWRDPTFAVARDAWNTDNMAPRRQRTLPEILAEWDALEPSVIAFHRPGGLPPDRQPWVQYGYVVDLAAHLHDIRHAVGVPDDRDTFSTWASFAIYRVALDLRVRALGLPAIGLQSGEHTWTAGAGSPAVVATVPPFELYRAIGGRRSWSQILAFDWEGDPEPYQDVIALYPVPARALEE